MAVKDWQWKKFEWDLTIIAIDIPMRTKPGPRVGVEEETEA